jgi:hypothetical protein
MRPVCADHPGATVIGWGHTADARRRRWKCLGGGTPHAPKLATREDLLGICLGCDRHWEHGYPTAVGAWFHLEQVVAFLASVAGGKAVGPSMRIARVGRHAVLTKRAKMAGLPAPAFPPPLAVRLWSIPRLKHVSRRNVRPEEDGRTGADWLGRYGAPFVAATLARSWPAVPVLVDSTKFQSSAVYPPGHPRAGQPKRGGSTAFVVMAAGVREQGGAFRIIHVRAVADESPASWRLFFESLPDRPREIHADQWPHIVSAANAVWPGITIRHSTWHAWDYLRRAFNKAHWYPGTHKLVADGPAAFIEPTAFTAWRAQAEASAPPTVKKWLRKYGDSHLLRISGLGPYSTGPLEAFLGSVRKSLDGFQGVITNLPRLDIRLGLMAAAANRQADPDTIRTTLLRVLGDRRLAYRELDGAPLDPAWILAGFPS